VGAVKVKQAQVLDTWRKALGRPYPTAYKKLEFAGLKRVGSGALSFTPGITALIGGNGVGKSTLMRALLRSLGPLREEQMAKMFGPTAGMTLNGTITVNTNAEVKTALTDEGVSVTPTGSNVPEFAWIDPSTYATHVRRLILNDANFADNLQGIDPQKFTEEDCDSISYVIGRKYESVHLYEVEEYGTQEELLPFFRVRVEGIDYDSVGMGLGELSLALIYWRLRALKSGTMVFIEEPETHISPRAQENLMDVCMAKALKNASSLVITTHSPFVLSKVPQSRVRLIVRAAQNVQVIENPSHDQIARVLGDRLTYHGAIVVEDELARSMTRALLRMLAPDLLEYFEVSVAGSNDEIVKALKGLPPLKNWFSLVGVFDGDQRGALDGQLFRWPHCFLPTNQAPEELIRPVIEGKRGALAAVVGCAEGNINVACDAAAGMEHHDYFITIRQSLGLDTQGLTDRTLQVWLTDEANKAQCDELIQCLRNVAHLIKQPTQE
jgi:predicted ATPase